MTDAVKPLTDAALATMREHARIGNRLWSLEDVRELIATIDALKATPSQSDVENAEKWLHENMLDGWTSQHRESLASLIAASRGTRTLTEEEREIFEAWRGNDLEPVKTFVAIISRLTGESSS